MTAKQVFEAALTEANKSGAPSLLLLDYNYLINKAVNQYINKRYNIYDTSLQTTDDLRVLKSLAILTPEDQTNSAYKELETLGAGAARLFGGTYEVTLPSDYLHMLNCICIYEVQKRHKCYDANDHVQFAAKRLTADAWSVIVTDYYNRPLPERPYYYIHNVNPSTDMQGEYNVSVTSKSVAGYPTEVRPNQTSGPNFDRVVTIGKQSVSNIERETAYRYGNVAPVRCEIRCGNDSSVFKLEKVLVDYIKAPLTIRLTLEQVDLTEDTSQLMEFPDYVCLEIINELVTLIMENSTNLRLLTFNAVTQSIANPAQQQLAPQQQH